MDFRLTRSETRLPSGTVEVTSEAGGRPAMVSSLEGEVGPGGISGVPRDLGDTIRLGGVGEWRTGGRMMAECRRANGRVLA